MENIWGDDLVDMKLISKCNSRIRFFSCVIYICNKYARVVFLKDKKGITITNVFLKILNESGCKPNKIWVNKGSKFYNRSLKSWLRDNDMEMYSTNNEGKFVVAERFMITLKSKIYKCVITISKDVYTNRLANIVNESNNTYRRTIKMKPVDVKSNTYIIDFDKESNEKDPKFEVS